MPQLKTICDYLGHFAPPELAEEWDNVGLLAGDPEASVRRVMTCLTITPASAEEAIGRQAELIVTHHPLPFRALKRLVTTTTPGRLLWELLTHRVAIYSPHTAFDSTAGGINQQLAEGLALAQIGPLVSIEGAGEGMGSGRVGQLENELLLAELAERLQQFLDIEHLQFVGSLTARIQRVAVACGAAGSLLEAARRADCDALVVGETNLHTCLEAEALQVALLLPGHYASERFAVERLADDLAHQFLDLEVWASQSETDPIQLY